MLVSIRAIGALALVPLLSLFLIASPSPGQVPETPLVELVGFLPGGQAIANQMNEWNSEMAACLAYYFISEESLTRAGELDGAEAYNRAAEQMFSYMVVTHRVETVMARVDLNMQAQIGEMNGNYANLSVLILQYADICKFLVESADSQFNIWFQFIEAAK
jgi:hypothetical protein